MMEFGYFKLCGKEINTIHKATMHDYGMDFFYNYYEDDSWENAGYSTKTHQVWSNKIGGRQFHRGIVAACILEELYLSDDAFVSIEGGFVNRDIYIGWINYIFNEKYSVRHRSLWGMFEAERDETDYVGEELTEELSWRDWWNGVEDAQDQTEYCENHKEEQFTRIIKHLKKVRQ